MQHLDDIELARRAVRAQVCPKCWQRPPHSELLGPTEPRLCEPTCAIFQSLPALQTMVQSSDPELNSIERAMRNKVCNHCTLSPSAGDYCSESLARTCPLSRYGQEVVSLLQRLPGANRDDPSGHF